MTTYTVTPKPASTLTAGTRFRYDGHSHTITRVTGPGGWEVKCDCTDDGNHSMNLFCMPDPDGLVDVIIDETEND
jgi:hypothetical protein